MGQAKLRPLGGLAGAFVAGVVAGSVVLHFVWNRPEGASEAQRRAIKILSQSAPAVDVGDSRIVQAVRAIEPAVVNIDTVSENSVADASGELFPVGPSDQEVRGKGSGVILTPDGYIVTNSHVIDGASRIRVTLPDNRFFFAKLVGRDPLTDLAVVRIDAGGLPSAVLGDSDRLQVGEWSIAVGNPLGLGSTVTVGVISALNRRNLQIEEGRTLDGAIQTDAAINRGNSGGALANIAGQLVGINTAILSAGPSGGSIGLGFAIPSNTVRRVARLLIERGGITSSQPGKPWVGVEFEPIPEDEAQSLGISATAGVSVHRVMPESPAALAGVHDGDIIEEIDGKPIPDMLTIRLFMLNRRTGEKLILHLLRPSDHRMLDKTLILQDRPQVMTRT